VQP
jgi:hypothetical protein